MNITFKNKKLAKIFNSEKELNRNYGSKLTRKLKIRMNVLSASPSLHDVPALPPDRRHELTGRKKGKFAVDLSANYRLIFKPVEPVEPVPKTSDGSIDLKVVTTIEILDIEDYH